MDKASEKIAESEEDLLEHRTDGTDAFDTLYIGCEKFPYRDSLSRHLVFYNEAVDIEDIREWVRSAYDQNLCLFTFCIFIFRTSGIISNVAQTIKIFISLILLCLIAFFQT